MRIRLRCLHSSQEPQEDSEEQYGTAGREDTGTDLREFVYYDSTDELKQVLPFTDSPVSTQSLSQVLVLPWPLCTNGTSMGTEEAARRGDRSKQQVWAPMGHPRPLHPRDSEPRTRQGLGREAAGQASIKAHPQSTAELQVCRASPVRGDTSHKVLLSKLQRPPERGEGRARATWKTQERKTPQKKNQNISPINVC